jgi:hypothetical protein
MIINQSHRPWFLATMALLLAGGLGYIAYALVSGNDIDSGSGLGLIYAGIGSALMLFAGLLGARRKIRIWRVGRATTWMRAHLWLGFLSFPFILFHSGFRLGNGLLTRVLMALFLVVFFSGLLGAVLQHRMPKIMTERVPMETVFDQIDRVISQLVDEAARLVGEVVESLEQEMERGEETEELLRAPGVTRKTTAVAVSDERVSRKIASFFQSQMKPYLQSRHLGKQRLANPVQAAGAFQQLKILVPQALWPKLDDLENICEEKRQLERQRSMHKFLHGWLLFHIPVSYTLLFLGAIHAVVALRY